MEHAVENRPARELDASLFQKLASQRFFHCFPNLHPTAWQMPPSDVGVPHEAEAVVVVEDDAPNTQCHSVDQTMVGPMEAADQAPCTHPRRPQQDNALLSGAPASDIFLLARLGA